MSVGLPDIVFQLISQIWKSKMASPAILQKLQNVNIFATDWPIFPKFDMLMSLDPLDPVNQKIWWF